MSYLCRTLFHVDLSPFNYLLQVVCLAYIKALAADVTRGLAAISYTKILGQSLTIPSFEN